jgi:hypothetical protein
MNKQLSDLIVGDKVFIFSGGWGHDLRIGVIAKVGKIHLILEGSDTKWRRSGGSAANSDSWSGSWIRPYEEKEWQDYLADRRDKAMRQKLQNFDWRGCDKELVEKVYELAIAKAEAGSEGK